ncbi:MAG: PAS domain S-box protein, partial [Leptolyngbyaceae cyanobacterium SM1_3_5]|nr:PAS domain S-box protein [Leptolyngbyaceae cyanobacterium SM1_3_5]
MLFPLVVWSALRFGQRGTTLASLVICGIALWGLAEGESPFLVSMTDSAQAVLAMQAFVGVVSVSGLFLAAAVAERQQAIGQLQNLTQTLDQQVIERTRQLQESEVRARRLIDSNLIGVAFWDEAGEIVEANQAFYDLLGHPPAELLNWQAILSQDASEAIATLHQATAQPIERDFRRADGSMLPVLVGSTRLDGTGVSFVLDLSERKRTQEALQESERRFRRLAESNIFGVAFGDFHGGIHYVNDYLLTMLGCDRAELLDGASRWFDMTPCESWPLDIRGGEELRTKGVCTPYEKEFIRKDGRRVPVLIGATLLQTPFDQQAEIIAFCVDLTPQKQAEAALRRTQAEVAALNQDLQRRVNELQALFEVIPIGIAIAQDADCRRIQMNSAFAQLLGISIYENVSTPSEGEMMPPFRVYGDGRELSGTELPLQQAAANGVEVRNVELDVVRRDGQVFNLYGYATPLLDEQKRPRGAVSAFVNITDRKRTEAKIAQLLMLEQSARNEAESAQRQLANIFETSPIGLGFLDRNQRFVAINEALAEINGLSPEAHIGKSIPEIFGESDPAMVDLIGQIYETGKPFIAPNYAMNVPNRIDRCPGYYNVYYVPDILPNGDVENLLIYILDVTDRVRLEQRELFLANASSLLSTSLDYEATLDRLANVTVPELADWCMVDVIEEGEMRARRVLFVSRFAVELGEI